MDDYPIPRSVWVDGHVLTVPVESVVQEALNRWSESKLDEFVAVLAPFGLHPYDLAMPRYERIVQAKDLEGVADAVDA